MQEQKCFKISEHEYFEVRRDDEVSAIFHDQLDITADIDRHSWKAVAFAGNFQILANHGISFITDRKSETLKLPLLFSFSQIEHKREVGSVKDYMRR